MKAASVFCFAESRKLSFKQEERFNLAQGWSLIKGPLGGREPGPPPSDVHAAVFRP